MLPAAGAALGALEPDVEVGVVSPPGPQLAQPAAVTLLRSAQGAFYDRIDENAVYPRMIGGRFEKKPLMSPPVPAESEPPGSDHAAGIASFRVPTVRAPGRAGQAEPDIHVHAVLMATVHGQHEPAAWLRKVAHHHQLTGVLTQCPAQVPHQADRIRMAVIALAVTPDADKAGAGGWQRPRPRDAAVGGSPDGDGRSQSCRLELRPRGRLCHGHDG